MELTAREQKYLKFLISEHERHGHNNGSAEKHAMCALLHSGVPKDWEE